MATDTIGELAKHRHRISQTYDTNEPITPPGGFLVIDTPARNGTVGTVSENYETCMMLSGGNDEPHNNLQPWLSVYLWYRAL